MMDALQRGHLGCRTLRLLAAVVLAGTLLAACGRGHNGMMAAQKTVPAVNTKALWIAQRHQRARIPSSAARRRYSGRSTSSVN